MRGVSYCNSIMLHHAHVSHAVLEQIPNHDKHLAYTVPLKCNIAFARQYFPQILILNVLLSTSTCTNSIRVKQGVEADVEDLIG